MTEKIKEIPLSADTVCRRISEMSQDIECQLMTELNEKNTLCNWMSMRINLD